MTTTISPALGHGPLTQQGVGSSPGFDAVDARRWMSDPDMGEGVTTYGTYRVSQRGAGANLSVDINMDDFAFVRGDAVTHQALYKAAPHASTINETISTADATNPRIDRVILELKDTQHDASGSSLFQTRVIAGTPTGGATLDNLTGAASVPNSALLLADVLVAATDTSIIDAEIRDRRAFVAGIPPLLTRVDMTPLLWPFPPTMADLAATATSMSGSHTNFQVAALAYLPRRIVNATRIRWRYAQDGTTALTGNYVFAICDASGRPIVNTGTVAFTGAIASVNERSETIAATTLEAGYYYIFVGLASLNAGVIRCSGFDVSTSAAYPPAVVARNVALRATSGGVTVPATLLGLTDAASLTSLVTSPVVPSVALSVG